MKIESHPIAKGFLSEKAQVLIVGTFPPRSTYEELEEDFFFYSSVRNHFWNIMENIFPKEILKKTKTRNQNISDLQIKNNKEKFSTTNHLAFLDFYTKIQRKCDSTKDSDLLGVDDIIMNNFLNEALDSCPKITKICCTYKLAYENLIQNLKLDLEKPIYNFQDREIEIIKLLPATRSRDKMELKVNQYKKYLF